MPNELRATFLMSSLPAETGGEIYNQHLYHHAKNGGWDARYISVETLRFDTRARVKRRLGWLPGKIVSWLTALAMAWELGDLRGLVIQDQEYSEVLFPANLLLRLRRRGTIVTIVHHLPDYDSSAPRRGRMARRRWKYAALLRPSVRILTVSAYSRREIVSLGIAPERIAVLSPGLDRASLRIHPRQPSGGEVRIAVVGGVFPRKGTLHLVEAFAKLGGTRAHLDVIGTITTDPAYYDLVRQTAEKSGVADRVHFHGRLPQDGVNRLLSRADIFAMPSLQEGFGIALLEGMFFGLPIVTTKVSAQPELVREGENGLLVPAADPVALAGALQRLIDHPGLRAGLGENGRRSLEGRFDWASTGRAFENLLRTLLHGDAPVPEFEVVRARRS